MLFYVLAFFSVLFRRRKKTKYPKDERIYLRIIAALLVLLLVMSILIFAEIQSITMDVQQKCYRALAALEKRTDIATDVQLEIQKDNEAYYYEQIQQERERWEEGLYYGAFGISFRANRLVMHIAKEIHRLFTHYRGNNIDVPA